MKNYYSKLIMMIIFVLSSLQELLPQSNIDSLFNMSLENIMNLEVKTAGKKSEKAADIPASVVIVSRDEIHRYGYRKIEDILRHITGLYLVEQHAWNGVTGFGVRGYSTEGSFSNMVIMINGNNVIKEGYIDQYVLSRIAVPVEAIEKIEVIRGPMAVMYGSGAFFGAINIITFDENTDDTHTIVSTNYGSNNTLGTFARYEKRNEDFHLAFNIGLNSTSGLNIPYTEMTSNMVDTSGKTYLERIGLSNNITTDGHLPKYNNSIRLTCKYSDFLFEIGHVTAEKGIIWYAPSYSKDGQLVTIEGTDFNIQYEKEIFDNLSVYSKLLYNNYNSYSKYSILNDNFYGYSDIKSSNLSFELNLFYNPFEFLNVLIAYQRDELLSASNNVDIPTFNQNNSVWKIKDGDDNIRHYVYSQVQYYPIDQIQLIAGIRTLIPGEYTYQRIFNQGYDNIVKYESSFTNENIRSNYRLGIVYNFIDNHYLKILSGTAYTDPNLRQNTTRLENIIKYGLGDIHELELKPSEISTNEIIYEALLYDWFSFKFSFFMNNLNNIIESSGTMDSTGTYVVITQNSGKINTNGIEFLLNFQPLKSVEFKVSGSYQQSKNMKDGFENIELGYSPTWLLYSKASWFIDENFTIAMNAVYVDFMKASWNQRDINPEIGARYGKEVPSYILLNTNIRYDNMFIKGLYLGLQVSNLLDSEIRFPTDPSNTWADRGFVDYGRQIFIDLGYEF